MGGDGYLHPVDGGCDGGDADEIAGFETLGDEPVGAGLAHHFDGAAADPVLGIDDEQVLFVEERASWDGEDVIEGLAFDFGVNEETGLEDVVGCGFGGFDGSDQVNGAGGAVDFALGAHDFSGPRDLTATEGGSELNGNCGVSLAVVDESVFVQRERQADFVGAEREEFSDGGSWRQVGAEFDAETAKAAGERCPDFGSFEIVLGFEEAGFGGFEAGGSAFDLGFAESEVGGFDALRDFFPFAQGLFGAGFFASESGAGVGEGGFSLGDCGCVVRRVDFDEDFVCVELFANVPFRGDGDDATGGLRGDGGDALCVDDAL